MALFFSPFKGDRKATSFKKRNWKEFLSSKSEGGTMASASRKIVSHSVDSISPTNTTDRPMSHLMPPKERLIRGEINETRYLPRGCNVLKIRGRSACRS